MVYIKKIDKEVFPCYLKPENDELFTSWLCRLSYNHNIKTNTFVSNYWGNKFPFWNRDIDVFAPENIISFINKHTPLTKDRVEQMFLKSYEGYAYDQYRKTGSIRNILPLGIKHRKRIQFGQQCCTKCLSKDIPYYKKSWRLISSIVCVECNHLLIDRCFICNAPIAFFRVNIKTRSNLSTMDFKPIYYCSNCSIDLRDYNTYRMPLKDEIDYQKYINNTIKYGYNDLTQYSFTFFRVLFLLARRIRSKTLNNRLRDVVLSTFSLSDDFIDKELRYWSIEQRMEILPFVLKLLHDTQTLRNLFFEGRVIKNYLVNDEDYIPYWFEKLLIY